MRATATVFQTLVRVTGVAQLVLGGLFWTGNQLTLIPLHVLSGMTLVLGLWALAGLAAVVRVSLAPVALAVAWGVLTVGFGMTQALILPGDFHLVVQVLHLLVGLAAIGQAERLARAIKAAPRLAPRPRMAGGSG
jgi:hypothetical protein